MNFDYHFQQVLPVVFGVVRISWLFFPPYKTPFFILHEQAQVVLHLKKLNTITITIGFFFQIIFFK